MFNSWKYSRSIKMDFVNLCRCIDIVSVIVELAGFGSLEGISIISTVAWTGPTCGRMTHQSLALAVISTLVFYHLKKHVDTDSMTPECATNQFSYVQCNVPLRVRLKRRQHSAILLDMILFAWPS